MKKIVFYLLSALSIATVDPSHSVHATSSKMTQATSLDHVEYNQGAFINPQETKTSTSLMGKLWNGTKWVASAPVAVPAYFIDIIPGFKAKYGKDHERKAQLFASAIYLIGLGPWGLSYFIPTHASMVLQILNALNMTYLGMTFVEFACYVYANHKTTFWICAPIFAAVIALLLCIDYNGCFTLLKGLPDEFVKKVTNITGWLSPTLKEVLDKISGTCKQTGDAVCEYVPDLCASNPNSRVRSVLDNFGNGVQQTLQTVNDGVQNGYSTVKATVNNGYTAVTAKTQEIAKTISNKAQEIGASLSENEFVKAYTSAFTNVDSNDATVQTQSDDQITQQSIKPTPTILQLSSEARRVAAQQLIQAQQHRNNELSLCVNSQPKTITSSSNTCPEPTLKDTCPVSTSKALIVSPSKQVVVLMQQPKCLAQPQQQSPSLASSAWTWVTSLPSVFMKAAHLS